MGKRTTARKLAMQVLYQKGISGSSISESLKEVATREGYLQETLQFAEKLANGAWEQRAASDLSIKKLSKNWSMDRMGQVVVSILRLAMYELSFEKDTPTSVVINEAVELAKKFSTDESAKFINGILGAYIKNGDLCSQA